jgi:phage terminase large subunit GpA-like protein
VLSGANSSAALQMFSFRYLFKDELSEWPEDAGGRGDPSDQADARTDAFEAIRKIYQASTPGLKGMCRISAEYDAADQRRYYVPCPFCATHQVLLWGNLEETAPGVVGYRCAACAAVIPHHAKAAMLRDDAAGGTALWIRCWPDDAGEVPADVLTAPELARWRDRGSGGRQPGFWISQLYSPFKSWASLIEQWRKSDGDVQKEKVFRQQVLGLEWEEEGEAPELDFLLLRREDYPLQRIPPGGLVLTTGIDVQKDYLQYEIVAWGRGRASWSIDFGVVAGDTASPAVWESLDRLLTRTYPDWQGVARPIEMAAIDAGYNTQWVYQFTRTRPRTMAVKGVPGHLAPALGLPAPQEVSWRGKRIKRGAMLWPIGDWTLKAELYANLRKPGPQDGAEAFPAGYCHFSTAHDKGFFEQLTAERLLTRVVRGREVREWVLRPGAKNEALDCRKMAMAAAVHLGLWRLDDDGWQQLAAQRGAPPEAPQGELPLTARLPEASRQTNSPIPVREPEQVGPPPAPTAPAAVADIGRGDEWLGRGTEHWF